VCNLAESEASLPEVPGLPLTAPCEPHPKENAIDEREAMEPKQPHGKKTAEDEPVKGGETEHSTSRCHLPSMMNADRIPAGKVIEKFCIRSPLKPRPKPSPLRQMHVVGSHESLLSAH
jgi:hypothetical protein